MSKGDERLEKLANAINFRDDGGIFSRENYCFCGKEMLFRILLMANKQRPRMEKNGVVKMVNWSAYGLKSRDIGPGDVNDNISNLKHPSILEIKASIPAHCFKSDLPTSLYHAVKDVTLVCVTFSVMCCLEKNLCWTAMLFAWPLYWAVQGTNFTAIFVLGHDCGHESFSKYDIINDVFGTVLHTFLLTPFYPWKLSHKNHHKNTGNIDKDEVFYPKRKSQWDGYKHVELFGLGFAWFIYLVTGYSPRAICHFNPHENMFLKHIIGCYLSIISYAAWAYCLFYYASLYGVTSLVCYYFIPLIIFATYLVVITFLHHTDVNVPWYSDDNWNFVKGQLSSIDRHYGLVHEWIHNIGTHQIHHFFPKVPHYHLEEATTHFRKAFPELVRTRDDAIIPAYIRMFKKFTKQFIVADDAKIHVFK